MTSLQCCLQDRGIQLVFKQGKPLTIIKQLLQNIDACAVYWNRCYEPYAIKRDQEIKSHLRYTGIICESFKTSLLAEPWELQTKSKKPYQVFTPFWKAFQCLTFSKPLPIPDIQGHKALVSSDELLTWRFKSKIWGSGFQEVWRPGEEGAWEKMNRFLEGII